MEVFFFPHGTTAVTQNNQQVENLQKSWFLLYVDFLVSQGIDPTKVIFHTLSGDVRVFKTETGFNWEFIE